MYEFRQEGDGPSIIFTVVRTSKEYLLLAVLSFVAFGWSVNLLGSLNDQPRQGSVEAGFDLLWTFGVMLLVPAALGTACWLFFGREIVTRVNGVFRIRKEVFGLGITREYDVTHVRNIRFRTAPVSLEPAGLPERSFAFDYGAGTFTFGEELNEKEVEQVLTLLRERLSLPVASKPFYIGWAPD